MTNIPALEFIVDPGWEEFAKKNPWASHIPEVAIDAQGQKFMRSRGRTAIYKVVSENENIQEYECTQCRSAIMDATVAHPIHSDMFPGAGRGDVREEYVPYCPKCEQQPAVHGTPIIEHEVLPMGPDITPSPISRVIKFLFTYGRNI